jgi:uncharacterized protein DUF6894
MSGYRGPAGFMRYYFHLHIVDGRSEVDDIGADFPSDAIAINEARNLAEEISAEAVRRGSKLEQVIEVTDQGGHTILLLKGEVKIEETRSTLP